MDMILVFYSRYQRSDNKKDRAIGDPAFNYKVKTQILYGLYAFAGTPCDYITRELDFNLLVG